MFEKVSMGGRFGKYGDARRKAWSRKFPVLQDFSLTGQVVSYKKQSHKCTGEHDVRLPDKSTEKQQLLVVEKLPEGFIRCVRGNRDFR